MQSTDPPGTGGPGGPEPSEGELRTDQVEQLALLPESGEESKSDAGAGKTGRKKSKATAKSSAGRLPVARVVVNKALSHLDQTFDYSVPARLDDRAVPGARVRVRFGGHVEQGRRTGGTLIDGYLVERRERSDYPGPLAPLHGAPSAEPVLSPELLRLCRAVADRYAGTLADVLQLAIPPRHASTEAEVSAPRAPTPNAPSSGPWARYPTGESYLRALAAGGAPRAVWSALPGPRWPEAVARAMAATLASGRGALAVLPDARQLAAVDRALTALLGTDQHVALSADLGPAERYRRWLRVNRAQVGAVAGTRAAMFAPVQNLGLVVIWDDGSDSHAAQHAPQPHAREVLLLRAHAQGAGALVGGHSRTVEAAQLVATGWAHPLQPDRRTLRASTPMLRTVVESDEGRDEAARVARLPSVAWRAAREALPRGPVLVQVPRSGYVPRLSCVRCREPARCGHCAGPVELPDRGGVLRCLWCGRLEGHWHCPACGANGLRAQVVGAERTADELGRAFPNTPVRVSGRDGVLSTVPDVPTLVVSTPGAEPVADAGYAAALLLDGSALLNRPDLRAGEVALRHWLTASSLVRSQDAGGQVVVLAEPTLRPVQALVRWDPEGFSEVELAERAELGFPPVSRMASVTGPRAAVAELVALVRMPEDGDVLGPVPVLARARSSQSAPSVWSGQEIERVLLRVPRGSGGALAAALKSAQAVRHTRKEAVPLQVRVDPRELA